MSYGFQSINDSSYVQIDSEAPRLCVLTRGTYSGVNTANATFARPVTSVDPPLVFVRPDAGAIQVPLSVWFTGGPGNWTGFSIKASNVQNTMSGVYFVAAWASMGTAAYGMRIWDGNGGLVYDSGAPAVIVTFAAGDWAYAGFEDLAIGRRWIWSIGRLLGPGEYISINPFSMYHHNQTAGGQCSIGVDYANSRILMYSVATTAWTANPGHRPFLCARLVA